MSRFSNDQKKLMAKELFNYGRMVVNDVPKDERNIRAGTEKRAQFFTWSTKDAKKTGPQEIIRIKEILKNLGLDWNDGGANMLGAQIINIIQSPDHPMVEWLLKVYKIINQKNLDVTLAQKLQSEGNG